MPSSIEQSVADIISNSSPAMRLAQVGAKIKESLDSIVDQLAEPPVWTSSFTGSSGKQVYYNNKLWISNASVVGTDVPGVSAKWDAADTAGGNSMSDADVTMDGTAATGVAVSYAYKQVSGLTHIAVSIGASDAGAANTQVVVDMSTYLAGPYNLPGPSLREPGLATINNGAAVVPCFWQTTNNTIVINLPSAMAFSAAEIRFTF